MAYFTSSRCTACSFYVLISIYVYAHLISYTDDKMHVFLSKGSNNLVFAKWVQPNQTLKTGLKYRIIWSDGKNIDKQVHY